MEGKCVLVYCQKEKTNKVGRSQYTNSSNYE